MPDQFISAEQLLKHVRVRTFDYSRFMRERVEVMREAPVTCAEGCAHCCYAKVMIDAGSGAVIAMALEQQGRWTQALVKRLTALDAEMSRATHADWMTSRRPCAFLYEEGQGRGSCTVYPWRPINCIATFSINDPAKCAVVGGRDGQFQIVDGNLRENLMLPHEAILNAAGETQMWLMTLPGAVLYGHALAFGEPRPPVHRVAKEDWQPGEADGEAFVGWIDDARPR